MITEIVFINEPGWDIPQDKSFPADAIQCDECGGHGCGPCEQRGWFPAGHPKGRRCYRDACNNPIPPAQIAVYCSNECAFLDASPIPLAERDKLPDGI